MTYLITAPTRYVIPTITVVSNGLASYYLYYGQ